MKYLKLSWLGAIVISGIASANLIQNGSFEADVPGPGWVGDVYVEATPTGWFSPYGVVGTWRPENYTGSAFVNGNTVRDGLNAGYTGDTGAAAFMGQKVAGYKIGAGDTITFSFSIGERIDNAGRNDANVGLYAQQASGSGQLLSLTSDSGADGHWHDHTITLGPRDLAPYVGQDLYIDLYSAAGKQGSYDNLSLTTTPEPASIAVLSVGAIALLRRRRK